jgi:hypothetical protein
LTETVPHGLPADLRCLTLDWLTDVLSVRYSGVMCFEVSVGTVVEGSAIKASSRSPTTNLPGLPPAMNVKGGLGERFATAAMDLDAFAIA